MKTRNYQTENQGNSITLDDIIFKNKNQEYGAFALRKSYLKTINRSFFMGAAIFVIGLAAPTIYGKLKPYEKETAVILKDLENVTPPVETPPVVELTPPPVEVPVVNTVRSIEMEIVPDVDPKEELPPTTEQLETAKPAETTVVANPDNIEVVVDETVNKPEVVEIKPEVDKEEIVIVEQYASFPGGTEKMSEFLSKNLRYPAPAQRANVSGKVFLSFVVDRTGRISDVELIKGIGFGCDEEAIRVVNLMPNWSPGKQSGRAVKSRFNLPIVFRLD